MNNFIKFVALFPFFICGLLFNFIPYILPSLVFKSLKIDLNVNVFEVLNSNWVVLKTGAKVVYQKGIDKKHFIKKFKFYSPGVEF